MRLISLLIGALTLAAAHPASAAEWHRATSRHFVVYSDGPVDGLRDFTGQLARFDEVLRGRTHVPEGDDSNPLTVFLVKDQTAVATAMGFSSNNSVYGYYEAHAGGNIAVASRQGTQRGDMFDLTARPTLFHEYTHHFMLQHFPQIYSRWYSEGIAELYSTTEFGSDDSVTIGKPVLYRLPMLRVSTITPLDQLLANPYGGGFQEDALYSKGWLLTHYVSFTPKYAERLPAYFAAMNAGKSDKAAMESAFGCTVTQLDRQMMAYLNKGTLPIITVAVPKGAVNEVKVEDVPPVQSILMDDFIQYSSGSPDFQKRRIAGHTRKVAADHPEDLFAQRFDAEAELDLKRYDDAQRAAEAALRIDPTDERAQLVIGQARMQALADAKSKDKAAWAAARAWVVKANHADPNDGLPLLVYYQSFSLEGVTPPTIASDGLFRALDLSPQDDKTRVLLAQDEARQGKYPDAVKTIRPVAARPHYSEVVKSAATLLSQWQQHVAAGQTAPAAGGSGS